MCLCLCVHGMHMMHMDAGSYYASTFLYGKARPTEISRKRKTEAAPSIGRPFPSKQCSSISLDMEEPKET